jgi:hypothetical protein
MWMRGGTSKGGYFLSADLPQDIAERDAFLLRVMGSPDRRQIDGMGGADPLTSKVAVVSKSDRPGIDVDYLFLQVFVDQAMVTDKQNCGNILAGVGPFAIERGLIELTDDETRVAIYMVNTGQVAIATVQTAGGKVRYDGEARIDGVPGTAAPIPLEFRDTAGSSCGALLPTGNAADEIEGVRCTLIDNGMPCVVFKATDVGATGYEDRDTLLGRAEGTHRSDPAPGRTADEPRRRDRQIGAQDDARRDPEKWRSSDGAQLHSPSRPCFGWCARRGQRGDRVPDRRFSGGRGCASSWRSAQDDFRRTSDGRDELPAGNQSFR